MDVRERLFVKEYVINKGNAYQAAMKAGYAKNTARNAFEWITQTLSDSDKKRHLPYKPYLKDAIEAELKKIEDAKTADEKEIMEYLSSVMRKEAKSSVVVVEGIGVGCSTAKIVEKPPDEKEALKAAELLGKVYGMFTDRVQGDLDTTLNIQVDYGEDNEK